MESNLSQLRDNHSKIYQRKIRCLRLILEDLLNQLYIIDNQLLINI